MIRAKVIESEVGYVGKYFDTPKKNFTDTFLNHVHM